MRFAGLFEGKNFGAGGAVLCCESPLKSLGDEGDLIDAS